MCSEIITPIYQNARIRIDVEPAEIPWLKLFTQHPYKEFSECDKHTREEIWGLLDVIEREMLAYYQPDKINIASFANYLPQVHWHIMARFKNDSYFPEPMWGAKQREADLQLPDFTLFTQQLIHAVTQRS